MYKNTAPVWLFSTGLLVRFSQRVARSARLAVFSLLALMLAPLQIPALAQNGEGASGLPLPRFVSLTSAPINVRVGPGTRYELAWVYVKSRLPVEIIQEFDTWRKIRDLDGQEGWVHQNLLSGRRMGYIAPWDETAKVALRARDNSQARVRAWLSSKFLVRIEKCDGRFCLVSARNSSGEGRATYSGYVAQFEIWGVYPGEEF
ncbi:MAG TPA: hypothetical protein ENJ90_00425 [Devosia sp.]|nr:hypothetical protein [Devosia sp.]